MTDTQDYGKRATDKPMATYTFVVEVKQVHEVTVSASSHEEAETMAKHWYLNGQCLSEQTQAHIVGKQPYVLTQPLEHKDAEQINTSITYTND